MKNGQYLDVQREEEQMRAQREGPQTDITERDRRAGPAALLSAVAHRATADVWNVRGKKSYRRIQASSLQKSTK